MTPMSPCCMTFFNLSYKFLMLARGSDRRWRQLLQSTVIASSASTPRLLTQRSSFSREFFLSKPHWSWHKMVSHPAASKQKNSANALGEIPHLQPHAPLKPQL